MKATKERFKIQTFTNRSGSTSWRVSGSRRNGERIRENFTIEQDAINRRLALEVEFHAAPTETALRSTRLSERQISLAESAFNLIEEQDLLRAINYWLKNGKQADVAESPTADEALEGFKGWLDGKPDSTGNGLCKLRPLSRRTFRNRAEVFVNQLGLVRVADVTPEQIEKYLGRLDVSATTKQNNKLAISRFFSWCMARPRQWRKDNPCAVIKIDRDEPGEPEILTPEQCEKLLRAAEANHMAPYVSVALFAGLRPFEVRRLTWDKVNLVDKEIRISGDTSKIGKSRVVAVGETLLAWLSAYKGKPFFPVNFGELLVKIRKDAGIKKWPHDVLRHTAISHYFRSCGSYGLTAEYFGNSEKIIKQHYQGRVSTEQTQTFYGIMPTPKPQ